MCRCVGREKGRRNSSLERGSKTRVVNKLLGSENSIKYFTILNLKLHSIEPTIALEGQQAVVSEAQLRTFS